MLCVRIKLGLLNVGTSHKIRSTCSLMFWIRSDLHHDIFTCEEDVHFTANNEIRRWVHLQCRNGLFEPLGNVVVIVIPPGKILCVSFKSHLHAHVTKCSKRKTWRNPFVYDFHIRTCFGSRPTKIVGVGVIQDYPRKILLRNRLPEEASPGHFPHVWSVAGWG